MPKIYIQGCKVEVASGQTEGTGEVTLTQDGLFFGVTVMLEDPMYGDELDFRIIHPDGVTVIGDYSMDTFLTSKVNQIEIKAEAGDMPGELPTGCKLRMIYKAIDTIGRKSVTWYRLKR